MSQLYIDFASLGSADNKTVIARSNVWFLVQGKRNALFSHHELGNPSSQVNQVCPWAQEAQGENADDLAQTEHFFFFFFVWKH